MSTPCNGDAARKIEGLEGEVKSALTSFVDKGYSTESNKDAILVAMKSVVTLKLHLKEQDQMAPAFTAYYSLFAHFHLINDKVVIQHMWGYVLSFVEESMLTGTDLDKMLDGIIDVVMCVFVVAGEGFKTFITMENKAKKDNASKSVKLLIEKWEQRVRTGQGGKEIFALLRTSR